MILVEFLFAPTVPSPPRPQNLHSLVPGAEVIGAGLTSGRLRLVTSSVMPMVKYSWWSYRFRAREKNAGWRIDYFIVSNRIAGKVTAAEIHNEVFGSDHCPVELVIDL